MKCDFAPGFKMVPSFTCTVEPETGDVKDPRSAKETGPGKGWCSEGVDVGCYGAGARARGLEQSTPQTPSLRQAGEGKGPAGLTRAWQVKS